MAYLVYKQNMNQITRRGPQNVIHFLNREYKNFGNITHADIFNAKKISLLDHSIKTARWMECNAHAKPFLVVAGLLHDYGYISDFHPTLGHNNNLNFTGSWILKDLGFPMDVILPISYHNLARQYLCTIDSNYYYSISQDARNLMMDLGGKLCSKQMMDFERNPHFSDSMLLLYASDMSYSTDKIHNNIIDYKNYIKHVLENKKN